MAIAIEIAGAGAARVLTRTVVVGGLCIVVARGAVGTTIARCQVTGSVIDGGRWVIVACRAVRAACTAGVLA